MKRIVAVEHVRGENLGTFQHTLDRLQIPVQWVYPTQNSRPDWPELLPGDGLVVLGGYMSVNETERYPWLGEELEFIRRSLASGCAFLGICLGMQLLARSLGAKVVKMEEPEIGIISVRKTHEGSRHPLFADLPDPFWAFSWHGEMVELPSNCQTLASSAACPIQAIACGTRILGLQFHLEADLPWIQALTGYPEYARDLAPGGSERLRGQLMAHQAELSWAANRLLSRWLELA